MQAFEVDSLKTNFEPNVMARSEMIEYADISFDYTRRGDPSELIPALAHLAAH